MDHRDVSGYMGLVNEALVSVTGSISQPVVTAAADFLKVLLEKKPSVERLF